MNIRRRRHRSQLQFQLDAISAELHKLAGGMYWQSDHGDTTFDLNISQTTDCVRVSVSGLPTLPEMELTPLFPGSYTQNDVAITIRCETDKNQLTDVPSLDAIRQAQHAPCTVSRLSALDPLLHFARFTPPPRDLAATYQHVNRAIFVLVDRAVIDSKASRKVFLQQLNDIVADNADCRDFVVVELCIGEKAKPFSGKNRWMRSLDSELFNTTQSFHIHPVMITRSEDLMNLFSETELVFVNTVSLAMDAANAGCLFRFYGEHPSQVVLLQHIGTLSSHQSSMGKLRDRLAQYQMDLAKARNLISYQYQLSEVIRHWIGSNMPSQQSILHSANQPTAYDAIIPVNASATAAWHLHLATLRAKVRKLRHSPKQFFQDSRNPGLRRLASLAW